MPRNRSPREGRSRLPREEGRHVRILVRSNPIRSRKFPARCLCARAAANRRARGFQPPAFVPRSILSATPMTLGPWSFRPGERFGSASCRRAESASRCPSTAPTRPRSRRAARSAGSRCGGYVVFTPGPDGGGRYTLLVRTTSEGGGPQRYRLQAAKAGPDDTSPGLALRDGQTNRGGLLAGALDALDLHRFTVARRSDVTLAMHAGSRARFDLTVLRDDGRRVACECGETGAVRARLRLSPGRYFAVVRARDYTGGHYRLSFSCARSRLPC